ncbi:helix-turn-helix domain-containing protein [Acidithiobacillus sp. ATCC 19703]|uniref:Helix-turn-helix domain-containing protein n=2 Tax=Acidithiobacillus concretivorus TaxID=3063952 RepID=A0ABS5ZPH9_9PROT|nr:helix-turn-helix domain-containing protein [Acidithiobacillus concretivorus]MBU2738538.1 helix-turn-helix domain-containing protein [Acidithiobacillus concretivorus]
MTTTTGDRIRLAREKAGLTMSELAHRINVSKQLVWSWENGKIKDPRPEYVIAIRDALNVSIDWLILGKGEMSEEDNPYRVMTPHQKAVLDLYEGLPDSIKKEFFQSLQDKKQFFDMIMQEMLEKNKRLK